MKFIAQSPTRVDLAGGTLDLWPLYSFLGECWTTNVAVDIWTYAELTPREDSTITFTIEDLNFERRYRNLDECLGDSSKETSLLRAHVLHWKPARGFHLKTWSESPIGGGIGGSSSLCVSLLSAFRAWNETPMDTLEQVELVHNIEAHVLKMPTGTQDYIPAITGGICFIRYAWDGIHIEQADPQEGEFEDHFLLIYTGKPHHSGFNNWQVLKDAIEGNTSTLSALRDLQTVAAEMKTAVQNRKLSILGHLFDQEYKCRVRISPVFTSPEIERLREVALRAGAQAVKICGAGGGGSVLVWCPTGKKEEVAQACQNGGFRVLSAKPTKRGTSVSREA